jgi:hypothetical protein
MTRLPPELASFREATEPSSERVAEARRRLRVDGAAAVCRRVLGTLAEPGPDAESRVRRRLNLPPRRVPWGVAGLAAAASLALWLGRPEPERAVSMTLVSVPAPVPVGELVQLHPDGDGFLSGTERRPRVRWDGGRLDVAVEPDMGVDLTVETTEARVHVVGTAFTVERDALGTRVTVERGTVEVTCAGGDPSRLTAGRSASCWPTRAAGLLARARALAARDESADAVLETLAVADARDAPAATRGEILALRFDVLRRAGHGDEALAAAAAYREEGHQERAAAVGAAAVGLALASEGCAGVGPWTPMLDAPTLAELRLRCPNP